MGVTIRQKTKGGAYWVFVHHNGRRASRRVGSLKAARAIAAEVEVALARGDFAFARVRGMPTFGEYARRWLDTYVERELRASSYDSYEGALRIHLLPAFGRRPLDQISRGDVRELLLDKAKTLAVSRVFVIHAVLGGIFTWAVEEGLLKENPMAGVTRRLFRREQKAARKGDAWSRAELERFLETCREREPGFYPLFLTLARTGCRLGEAIALKWGNVDLPGRAITIKEAYRRGRITPPKNGKPRTVDMSAQLAKVLEGWKLAKCLDAEALVFPAPDGRYLGQGDVRRAFERIVRAAGVKRIRLHDLRHTAASLLLAKGVSPYYVSRLLGHSTIMGTVDTYGHMIRDEQPYHVDLLDSAL